MSLDFDLQYSMREYDLNLCGIFERGVSGICGDSGSGKSTFMNLLSGITKPDRGKIILNNRVLFDSEKGIAVPLHKRKIAYVFQDRLLFPHLTIRENLLFSRPYGGSNNIEYDEVVEILELQSLLSAKPHEISGGEQQRVAIGRALLSSPELVLMDESFCNLDSRLRTSILSSLRNLEKRLGIPIIVISHDLEDLKSLTEEIYCLSEGILLKNDCRPYVFSSVKTG